MRNTTQQRNFADAADSKKRVQNIFAATKEVVKVVHASGVTGRAKYATGIASGQIQQDDSLVPQRLPVLTVQLVEPDARRMPNQDRKGISQSELEPYFHCWRGYSRSYLPCSDAFQPCGSKQAD